MVNKYGKQHFKNTGEIDEIQEFLPLKPEIGQRINKKDQKTSVMDKIMQNTLDHPTKTVVMTSKTLGADSSFEIEDSLIFNENREMMTGMTTKLLPIIKQVKMPMTTSMMTRKTSV